MYIYIYIYIYIYTYVIVATNRSPGSAPARRSPHSDRPATDRGGPVAGPVGSPCSVCRKPCSGSYIV